MDVNALGRVLAPDELNQNALDALEAFNSEIKRSRIDTNEIPLYFDVLSQIFEKRDNPLTPRIKQLAFRTINNLARRALTQYPENISFVGPVVPVLFDHLAPQGFAVDGQPPLDASTNAVRAAATLQDLYLADPKMIEQVLRECGLNHSRADVRCGSLMLLEAHLRLCNGKFKSFTPVVTHLLNDRDPAVSTAASDLLCSFFCNAPGHAKTDLAKELKRQRVDERIAGSVIASIGLTVEQQQQQQHPVDGEMAQSPEPNNAPLIHEIIQNPLYKLQELKPEDVDSVASFRSIVQSLQPLFKGKETDTNWEARERAINRLRALVRGNIIDYPGDIVWGLKLLAHDIKAALYSLRTTVASTALHLVKDCSQLLRSYMDPLIDPYMQFLCEVTASTKKITSNLAYIATCSLILNTSMSMKTIGYIHNCVNVQLQNARVAAYKWYHIMFVCHSPDIRLMLESTSAVDLVLKDVKKGLTDPTSPVREATRSVFWLFAALWPKKAEDLGTSLDSQAKKQLLRSQPKELLHSYDHNFELHVKKAKTAVNARATPSRPPSSQSTSTRPASRNASSRLDNGRPGTATSIRRAERATTMPVNAKVIPMDVDEKRQVLTAQAHVPDIIRRISRALNDPKQKPDGKIEVEPVPENIDPKYNFTQPNEHIAAAISTAKKLVDTMPSEPTRESPTMGTSEEEAVASENVDQQMEASSPVPTQEDTVMEDAEAAQNEPVTKVVEEPATGLVKDAENAESMDKAPEDAGPKKGFEAGMLIESLVDSAREAVAETLQEHGSGNTDLNFDPSQFDKGFKITSASDFKDALKSELSELPTIDISLDAVANKTAQKMAPKFEEYVKLYPESKDAIMQAAQLVESAARKKDENKDDKAAQDSEESDDDDNKKGADNVEDGGDEAPMKDALDEVSKKINKDTERTSSKLNSLADLLDADDVETVSMGVSVLSYVLRGKRPPSEAISSLGTLSIPPPDLIGKALNYLFDQAMVHNPQVKDLLERYASSDLVALTISYVGHAIVMYVAVHLLPAEALFLTIQAIKPLLNIGTIIDTLFEIANADDMSDAALIALGGLLTGFDKVPLSPALRSKAKSALEVVYRLGDLTSDATAFLADWIGFESDSDDSSDSDDDSDEEKIAEIHARRFERNMAKRAPGAVAGAIAVIALEQSEPEIAASLNTLKLRSVDENGSEESETGNSQQLSSEHSETLKKQDEQLNAQEQNQEQQEDQDKDAIYAEPISSLHPVSISYRPVAQSNKSVRRFKIFNSSSLDLSETPDPLDTINIHTVFSSVPENQAECLRLLESLSAQLDGCSITKQGLIQLITLSRGPNGSEGEGVVAFKLWEDLPQLHYRIGRSILKFCELRKFKEDVLSLGLILIRTLLESGCYNNAVDQLRVLECLVTVSTLKLPTAIEFAALPKTRDALLMRRVDADQFIVNLINVFETGTSTSSRIFALKTMRQVVVKTTNYPVALQNTVRTAITDDDVHIRKEAYPILLNIHMQSESAAKAIKEQLTQGQQRLFEYYADQV